MDATRKTREGLHAHQRSHDRTEKAMTKMKTLSAVIILSAIVATPGFAQPAHHGRTDYRGSYNQLNEPYAAPQTQGQRNIENFGFSGRDPSRVGGMDPSLNPSGS
jgi:hypothetical protein